MILIGNLTSIGILTGVVAMIGIFIYLFTSLMTLLLAYFSHRRSAANSVTTPAHVSGLNPLSRQDLAEKRSRMMAGKIF